MRLKTLLKLLITLPVIAVVAYAGGYVSQFITNYAEWTNMGHFAGDGTHPEFPSTGISDCLRALARFPEGLYGIGVCIGLIVVLLVFVMRLGRDSGGEVDRERNLIYSSKGTYGTSGFMTPGEMKKVLETVSNIKSTSACSVRRRNCAKLIRSTRGTILGQLDGKIVCVPEKSRMNRNIAVYGASGSMKSRAFARNMIFQCVKRGESLFITDPKSELYEDMSEYLRQNKYTVKVFNLINPENSDSWNCLSEIEGQEIMAQLFSDVVIKNTSEGRYEHFWDNAELNLLKALVLFVEQGYPPEGKNIGEVYKLLTLNSEDKLNSLFDSLPVGHPAKSPYMIFKQAADTVRGGVIIGLGSRLQVFQNKLIRMITGYDEIDLTLPGREKCAYFCITSDQDSTFDFLSSLFLSFLFIKLVRYADKKGVGGKLPVPVHILADELANIGVIPDLTKKISTIRSRNISMSVIFQNLAQMQNRYPQNQWQEIIGNCDVQLFLGCTDEITAKFISDRTGDVTIGVSSKAKQLNTWRVSNYTPQYRETNSIGKRKLLTMDEVLRLPIDEALVIIRGHKVLKVYKYDYTLHPESKKLSPKKASAHVPAWFSKLNEAERDFSSYANPQDKKGKKNNPKKNDSGLPKSNPSGKDNSDETADTDKPDNTESPDVHNDESSLRNNEPLADSNVNVPDEPDESGKNKSSDYNVIPDDAPQINNNSGNEEIPDESAEKTSFRTDWDFIMNKVKNMNNTK
ncbi:MAG: type IV secretory system conjugative DNA transfer family protein [Oscillospiraceae bacterium]|nr:type IV secretory system conjugative DNA transfer family protein [Oscillospiraceae bacterium]